MSDATTVTYTRLDLSRQALFKQYQALADVEPNVTFVGRLAQYRYYNMDQVVAAALSAADTMLEAQQ